MRPASSPLPWPGAQGPAGAEVDCRALRDFVARNEISRIVLAEPEASDELGELLIDCKLRGVVVESATDSFERLRAKVPVRTLCPEALVDADGYRVARWYAAVKRVMDILFSLGLLVVTAPVLLVIAIAIKLDSRGPILFRQERVGQHGRIFRLLKFRSMRLDAESGCGPVWAVERDARVTRLGNFLRKYRLDEIPQAVNVLRGEMSFIGPRPERPHFVELLKQEIRYYGLRHCVKPGITGWAQVRYRYGGSVEDAFEKLQYDLYYMKHMSLVADVRIFLATVKVVLFGTGR
jgi:exopolysaccharide biosynthesis polyprenyl glycosylphosphotransferase